MKEYTVVSNRIVGYPLNLHCPMFNGDFVLFLDTNKKDYGYEIDGELVKVLRVNKIQVNTESFILYDDPSIKSLSLLNYTASKGYACNKNHFVLFNNCLAYVYAPNYTNDIDEMLNRAEREVYKLVD